MLSFRNLIVGVLIVAFFIGANTLHAQNHKNYIDINIVFGVGFGDNGVSSFMFDEFTPRLPSPISYTHFFREHGVSIKRIRYNFVYNDITPESIPGELLTRRFILISLAYTRQYTILNRLKVFPHGGISYRYDGGERIFLFFHNDSATIGANNYKHLGFNLGLTSRFRVFDNLFIKTEIEHIQFFKDPKSQFSLTFGLSIGL